MRKTVLFIIFILFLSLAGNNYADRKYFARSYMANTLPAGALEFELWNTARIGKAAGFFYGFKPQFEFEYGVTDRFSASIYMNFNQVETSGNSFEEKSFGFTSTALELRYRFTNPGQTFVDPAVYFEFGYGGEEIEYESKIILSKRLGGFVTALNLTSEIERDVPASRHESGFEFTYGLAYDLSPHVAVGFELRNDRGFDGIYGEEESQATYLGPTLNFQAESFYLTFNIMAQIGGSPATQSRLELIHHEKYEVRTIIGVEL